MLGPIEMVECVAVCVDPLPLHCCYVQSGLQSCSSLQADMTSAIGLIGPGWLFCGTLCALVCLTVVCLTVACLTVVCLPVACLLAS